MRLFLSFLGNMCLYGVIAIFLENTILSRALGASTSLWMIRKKYNIFLFGLVMTVITTISAVIAFYVTPVVQEWNGKLDWTPFVYVGIIGVVYILLLLITNRIPMQKKNMVQVFIHRCSFNCAVLGALLLSTQANLELSGYIGFGIGTGIGFTFATYLVYIAYEKLNSPTIPKAFRGFPITLFYIGILSLAVYGMIGHELPI